MTTITYPTAQELFAEIKGFISSFDVVPSDWDEFVYEYISENYDDQFVGDNQWFNENDTDKKDKLTDKVMELFGVR